VQIRSRKLSGVMAMAIVAAIVAATAPEAAKAQNIEVVAAGEVAGDNVNLLLVEGTAGTGRLGLSPTFTLQSYLVTFPRQVDGTDNALALVPLVGLRYLTPQGLIQARVGYSFGLGDARTPAIPVFGAAEDGIVTSLHGEYWGAGALALQGIASYNLGAEYLWTRGRALIGVHQTPQANFAGGLELAWQGDMSEEDSYRAMQIGPVVQWSGRSGFVWNVSGGWKNTVRPNEIAPHGQTWYARTEMVVPLFSTR
jgi:hypothetical protein